MVGIFKGSTPVNPSLGGVALKEVYVGSVKVWPTNPPYPWLELVGSQAVAISGALASVLYRSNPNITLGDIAGNVVRSTFPTTVAFLMGGVRSAINTYTQNGITLRPLSTNIVDSEAFRDSASQANDAMFVKVGVSLSVGDYIDGVFFRFSSAGALSFTTDAGLIVTRTGTGVYVVDLPAGKRLVAISSVIMTPQGTGLVIPSVTTVNSQRTGFIISCFNTAVTAVDTSLAVYIAMTDI